MVIVFWGGESEHLHVFHDDDAGAGAVSNCVHCVGVGCGGPISPHSRLALHVQQPRPPWILHATPGSSGFSLPSLPPSPKCIRSSHGLGLASPSVQYPLSLSPLDHEELWFIDLHQFRVLLEYLLNPTEDAFSSPILPSSPCNVADASIYI